MADDVDYHLINPGTNGKLDFSFNWTDWLDTNVTITGTPVWTVFPTGPTVSDESNTTLVTTAFLSDCTLGVVYLLSCKITTNASVAQTSERTKAIRCEQR